MNFYPYTVCDRNVTEVGVLARLWRHRWWGWQRVATNDNPAKRNNYYMVFQSANWKCSGEFNYRGTSTHYSKEGGRTYTGGRESAPALSCYVSDALLPIRTLRLPRIRLGTQQTRSLGF